MTVVAGYTALFPAEDPASKPVPRKSTAKTSSKVVTYTPDDYNLRFAAYAEPPKNSFKPLIVRQDLSTAPTALGTLPGSFTNDGGIWAYSGRVVVNGVAQGLLEERKSGDAIFVEKGQRWKNTTILEVGADSISFSGPEGATFTLIAGEAGEPAPNTSVTAPGGVAPVTVPPGMVGQIGGNLGVQPSGNPNQNNNDRPRRGRGGWNQGNEE